MTDFRVILLLITSGANLGLALFIIFKDFRNKIRIHFSLMLFWISMWSLFSALFIISPSIIAANNISMTMYVSAVFIAFFFFFFSKYFPFELHSSKRQYQYFHALLLASVLFVVIIIRVEWVILLNAQGDHNTVIRTIPFLIFTIYFLAYIISSFFILVKKIRTTTSLHKKMLKIVFFSTFMAALCGSFFNLFLTSFTFAYTWVGPLFTLITVFVIAKYIFVDA